MVLQSHNTPKTSLQEEYSKLSDTDKKRVRDNITISCDVSETTFYDWLKNPALITSKPHQHFIAVTVFGKTVQELFHN